MTVADDVRQGKINAYIDDWMVKLNARVKELSAAGPAAGGRTGPRHL